MIVVCLILIGLLTPIFGQLPPEIDLEADSIQYGRNQKLLIARDNVLLSYQGYQVRTSLFKFDSETLQVNLPERLSLSLDDQIIEGQDLSYDFVHHKGHISSLRFLNESILITSEYAELMPQKIILHNSMFTSCFKPKPDYSVQSKKIVVYPLLGLMVARNNRLSINGLPFAIPVPYYPYRSESNNILKNTGYLPTLGQNNIQGNYAIYKISYLVNKAMSGTVDFGYTQELEWLIGGSNVIAYSDSLRQGMEYHFYPKHSISSLYAVINYKWALTDEAKKSNVFEQLFDTFSSQQALPSVEANLIYQKQRLIKDYWVDFLPQFNLNFSNISMFSLSSNASMMVSHTKESNLAGYSFKTSQATLKHEISKKHNVYSLVSLEGRLSSTAQLYDDYANWHRMFFITAVRADVVLKPMVSYYQQLVSAGESPFEFENEYALVSNELGVSLEQSLYALTFKVESQYTFKLKDFRTFDVTLLIDQHCWNSGFVWKTKQNSINVVVNVLH